MNTRKAFRGIAAVLVGLALAGCAANPEPPLLTPEQFAELSVPLDVREFRTSAGSGTQAIFIKLSRLPDGLDHHVDNAAGSIVLDIRGPTGPAGEQEESLQAESPLSRIRIARAPQVLRLSLDLARGDVPPYSVHLLSDWIMVRLDLASIQG